MSNKLQFKGAVTKFQKNYNFFPYNNYFRVIFPVSTTFLTHS